MKQVFEEIMIAIQSLIDTIKTELEMDIEPKEQAYLTELSSKLKDVIFSCQNFNFEEMPYYLDIVEKIYSLSNLESEEYSARTDRYFKQMINLSIYVKNIRSKYAFNTLLESISKRPIKISEFVDKVVREAKGKRRKYDLMEASYKNTGYVDPRLDLVKMQEILFCAEENEKAFQSITTVSFTKLYLKYIVSNCYEMLEKPQYIYFAGTIQKVIDKLVEVEEAPIVTSNNNYYDLICDAVNYAIELLRMTCFDGEKLVHIIYLMQLLRIQLDYEKHMQIQQYLECDSSRFIDTPIDYDQLIARVRNRIELEYKSSLQSPILELRTNCPCYMNLDQDSDSDPILTEEKIGQLQYLDRIFFSQMLLSGLIKLRKDKQKSLN